MQVLDEIPLCYSNCFSNVSKVCIAILPQGAINNRVELAMSSWKCSDKATAGWQSRKSNWQQRGVPEPGTGSRASNTDVPWRGGSMESITESPWRSNQAADAANARFT